MSEEFKDLEYTERIARLIVRYHRNELTESESLELGVWCAQSPRNQEFFDRLSDPDYVRDRIKGLPELRALKKKGWEKIIAAIGEEDPLRRQAPVKRIDRVRYMMIAASLVGLLIAGIWLYAVRFHSKTDADIPSSLASNFKNDVAPGKDKAVLTLADGSSLVLDSTGSGTIARQSGADVVKVAKGSLAYSSTAEKTGNVVLYNTLTTPAAAQFQLTLPDGTKVWLNNASSLRYPVLFQGNERVVELKGEAYFEVAKNVTQPFRVKAGGALVDVLGTSFNVAAYDDEQSIKTTLLTGGVSVSQSGAQHAAATVLHPGEQAQLTAGGDLKTAKDVDVDGVVAWKNGLFHFDKADIRTVMKMLSRWYDVEVVYDGPVTNRLFGGDIQRNLNLSEVLTILQRNKVNFLLEGRTLTVRP